MSLPRYQEYKDSGVEWLGAIPSHWTMDRLKRRCHVFPSSVDKKTVDGETMVRLCNYTDVYYNDRIVSDMSLMDATASDEQIAKFTLRAGDTVFTKDSETSNDIGVAAYVPSDLPGIVCGYHLSIARPIADVDGAYVKWLFDAHYTKARFAVLANGLTRVGLNQYAVDNVDLPWPSFDEQFAIAAFLGRETAKIDALIAEQEKLLTLLAEKRQATISHAVSRGLDPNAPMKDSGIPWLGDVPAHWSITRLKFIATVQTGIAKGKDTTGKQTVTVPYLRVANVQDGHLALERVATIDIESEQLERYRLQPGDVLMNEGGDFDKLGRGAVWDGAIENCIHQNHVFAVRPHGASPQWLNQITGSRYAQFYFMGRSKQSTNLASISSTNIMQLPIVLPPSDEQAAILKFVHDEMTTVDTLHAAGQHTIDLLKERRSALIAAAVTGKIDVRDSIAQHGGA